jgi:hypothetical protein
MPLLAASVLLTGGVGTSLLFTGGTADAAVCAVGTPCAVPATLTMTAGILSLTAPPAIGWAETVTGLDQQLSDPTPADEAYTVDDSTGTAAGWNVTASATPFTYDDVATTTIYTLGTAATTGVGAVNAVPTFATNGSLISMTAATAPGAACAGTSTCTLPTDSLAGTAVTDPNDLPAGPVVYPVNLTYGQGATGAGPTGAGTLTPLSIYNADAGTGLGTIVIGADTGANAGDNPVGWWINVPSNTFVGTYTSTVSLNLISGP